MCKSRKNGVASALPLRGEMWYRRAIARTEIIRADIIYGTRGRRSVPLSNLMGHRYTTPLVCNNSLIGATVYCDSDRRKGVEIWTNSSIVVHGPICYYLPYALPSEVLIRHSTSTPFIMTALSWTGSRLTRTVRILADSRFRSCDRSACPVRSH
jgi:hypothetical protein